MKQLRVYLSSTFEDLSAYRSRRVSGAPEGWDRRGEERNAALLLSIDAGLDAAEESCPGLAGKAVELYVFAALIASRAESLA